MATHEGCGPRKGSTDGTLALCRTITVVICITSLKPGHTVSRVPRNYSRNIVSCQTSPLLNISHFKALTDELTDTTTIANTTHEGHRLIKLLQANIQKILHPPKVLEEQRVRTQIEEKRKQRVIDNTPILTATCITDAPPIMQARNPMTKWTIKTTPRLHSHVTRNNTPGAVPIITRPPQIAAQ